MIIFPLKMKEGRRRGKLSPLPPPLVSGASFFRVRTTTRVTTASIPPIIKNSSGLAFYSNVQTKN